MSSDPNNERRAKLSKTWLLMADAVLRSLQVDQPSASALDVARRWLDSNGTNLAALQQWAGGLGFDPNLLPQFGDEDNSDQGGGGEASLADPLRHVPPFADAE